MADEIIETTENTTPEVNTADLYLDNLSKIKANTVEKSAYDKLAEENKRLANALMNGSYESQVNTQEEIDIKELENDIKHNKQPNDVEMFEKVLKLRDARLAIDETDDIFVSDKTDPSDYERARAAAEFLRNSIERSNGDPVEFASRMATLK